MLAGMTATDVTWIGFTGLKVRCLIGILPHECVEPQEIVISLKMLLPPRESMDDTLSSTIDYTELARDCRRNAALGHHGLLETLAAHLIERLFGRYHCTYAWIRIEKPAAIPDAACAFVEHEKRTFERDLL
jgi:dihydroneopterin aldolase